jgi:hypothetical protein
MTTTEGGAVSWGAVIAGAVGAAALSLVLFVLGTGFGLAVLSPWDRDDSATAATVSSVLWVTFVQLAASVLGGYLAGRLRTRWVTVHSNEVYFRDTAHGFLAWAVSTLLMATLLSSAVGAMVSTGVKAGGAALGAAATAVAGGAAGPANPMDYHVDSLFRAAPNPNAPASAQERNAEVTRIFANALETGELGSAETEYLGQLVAARTGLSQAEAQQRVKDGFAALKTRLQQTAIEAKKVADEARKASAALALWLVVSLLIGAFMAALSATFGGRLRDSAVLATT